MKNLSQENAPIYEALERFRRMRIVPFDVPGHKHGRGNKELVELLGERCVSIDVNSMKPLDNLCHPVSVIKDAEQLAAEAFHASHAFLMVGGTTSSVQAMVLSCCKKGDKIILPRNVHRSVINALVLCGAIPIYVNPDVEHSLGISLGMKVSQVELAIQKHPDAVAVFVNNPTYYGICSDLRSIVKKAHAHGMKVLVDEAHGTHFYFGENLPVSAMEAGAEYAHIRRKSHTEFLFACRSVYACGLCETDHQPDADHQRFLSFTVQSGYFQKKSGSQGKRILCKSEPDGRVCKRRDQSDRRILCIFKRADQWRQYL